MTSENTEYKLPPTGQVYDPYKREKRRDFERTLAADTEKRMAMEWFLGIGAFAPAEDGTPHAAYMPAGASGFIDSVRHGYVEWGSITPKQLEAVMRFYATVDRKLIQPAQAAEAEATTLFTGEVGERRRFTLTVEKVHTLNPNKKRPTVQHVNKCRDADGNCVVLIGGAKMTEGAIMRVRATISQHTRHKGEAQTHIVNVQILTNRKPRRFQYDPTSNHD